MSEQDEKVEHNWFIRWKHTLLGRICWTVLDFVIVYIFATISIDSGRLLAWALVILFAIDGIYNLIRLIGKLINGNKEAAA